MRALLADVELEPQFQQLQLQLHLPSMKISSKEIVGTARHLALSDVLQSTVGVCARRGGSWDVPRSGLTCAGRRGVSQAVEVMMVGLRLGV